MAEKTKLGRLLRTIGLWGLIICAAASTTILFIKGQLWWAVFMLTIAAIVGIFEVTCYIKHKKTISNKYTEFMQEDPLWGAIAILFFFLAMGFLTLHLIAL